MARDLTLEEKAKIGVEMDAAAEVAMTEFRAMSQHDTVPMARWCPMRPSTLCQDTMLIEALRKAGHKRLGRGVVAFAKAMKGTGPDQWADKDSEAALDKIHPGNDESPS